MLLPKYGPTFLLMIQDLMPWKGYIALTDEHLLPYVNP